MSLESQESREERNNMKRVLIVVLLLAGLAFGQDALVIQLSPEDAAKARLLHAKMQSAEDEYFTFRTHIREEYLEFNADDNELGQCEFFTVLKSAAGSHRKVKWGWGCGEFSFSQDFKFIVPKPEPPLQPSTLPQMCGIAGCWAIVPGATN